MNPTKQVHSMELACHEFITIIRAHTVRYLKANKKRKRTHDRHTVKLHNHVFTTSHIIGTTTFLFFFPVGGKKVRGRGR